MLNMVTPMVVGSMGRFGQPKGYAGLASSQRDSPASMTKPGVVLDEHRGLIAVLKKALNEVL
jgi:hypothetical protein